MKETFEYGYYKFRILPENKIRLTKFKGKDERVTVPEKIMHYTVTEIGVGAFQFNCNIVEVGLPPSIEKIEAFSFSECVRLEKINIPPLVKKIEKYTFEDCINLEWVILENKNCEVCEYAFCNSKAKIIPK